MAKRMTLIVALILFGAGGVCRGEGTLTDTIGNPASGACRNPPASQLARGDDPNRRMETLLGPPDNLRQKLVKWKLIWFVDQPSHMNYKRIHGGLQ
jgi:hypothetical protein